MTATLLILLKVAVAGIILAIGMDSTLKDAAYLWHSGGKWTVPVGGGVGKLFRVGGQAVKVDLDSYYNAIRPTASKETWLVQVKLTFVFPE